MLYSFLLKINIIELNLKNICLLFNHTFYTSEKLLTLNGKPWHDEVMKIIESSLHMEPLCKETD